MSSTQPNNTGGGPSPADADPASSSTPSAPSPAGSSRLPKPLASPLEPPLWNNPITALGLFITTIALILLVTFGLFNTVAPSSNPYVDIVGLMVIPMILITGMAMVPLGTLLKSWWIRRYRPEQPLRFGFPRINLEDPVQRRTAMYLAGVTVILLPVVGVASYHGYHFTDSTKFCAEACHTVMIPEARAFYDSAHARVACAECHIGSGASWFVKSKLSGTRQVLAMFRESYSRPIPPAITELRPARETCEECHWPKKFYGAQLREIARYGSDEQNIRTEIQMLVKTGGGEEESGRAHGIHYYHVSAENLVEYVAVDPRLQEIPWIRWVSPDGRERIFRSDGKSASDPRPDGLVRKLDCMDCHNRAAHHFYSPSEAVDLQLEAGRIDRTLPFIKRESVRTLLEEYPDEETALRRIGETLASYYEKEHPEVWRTRQASINQAVEGVREAYQRNFFPYMRVNWQTYPDNIGHKYQPGCYRCHDGKHVDEQGGIVRHDCNICHTFLNAVPDESDRSLVREGSFVHPTELVGVHQDLACHQCHTGGLTPEPTCTGCHTDTQALFSGTGAQWSRFEVEPDGMFDDLSCQDCHDLSKPLDPGIMNATCLTCHDDDPQTFDGLVTRWREEMQRLHQQTAQAVAAVRMKPGSAKDTANAAWLDEAEGTLAALERAVPQHNMEGARIIYEKLRQEASAR